MTRALLFLLLAAFPQTGPGVPGILEGRVVRAGSTDPIPNALVTLMAATPNESTSLIGGLESLRRNAGGPEAAAAAIAEYQKANGITPGFQVFVLTDAAGRFTFKDISPGQYSLRAERQGYTGPRVNGISPTGTVKTLTVDRNRSTEPVDLPLTPTATLAGRVRDSLGNPAAGAIVSVFYTIYLNGREVFAPGKKTATDDHGEFRMPGVAPARFFLKATPMPTSPETPSPWEPTYFPNATDIETATSLEAIAGIENASIDVELQPHKGPFYKIKGTAINPYALPDPTTGVVDRSISSFTLLPENFSPLESFLPSVPNAIPVTARQGGKFEITDVRPGSYALSAAYRINNRKLVSASIPVEVRDTDVDKISLVLAEGIKVQGEIQARGSQASAFKAEAISLTLESQGPFTTVERFTPDASGKFSREDVRPAGYRLQVAGLPDTAFVADIREGGASVFDDGFFVDSKTELIQIIVDTDGRTVTGTVRNAAGQPAGNATVALVPPEGQRENIMRYKNGSTDEAGRFTIRGVPPGRYTAYAWESIFPSAWLNEKYVSKYQDRGSPVTVGTATSGELNLILIPAEN